MTQKRNIKQQAITYGTKELGRLLPGFLLSQVRQRCFTSVDIPASDPVFEAVSDWAAEQRFTQVASRLQATSRVSRSSGITPVDDDDDEVKPLSVRYLAGSGIHRFTYNGTLMWLVRSEGRAKSSEGWNSMVSLEIRALGRSSAPIKRLIAEACEAYQRKNRQSLALYVNREGWWGRVPRQPLRRLDSVILSTDTKQPLVEDVERFIDRRDWYTGMGIPYRRGYLLYGVPGSGKTSLVVALASHFNLPIYILNLSSNRMDDSRLMHAMSSMGQPSILLLEDVDAIFTQRYGDGSVSFSGLLNALDGASASEGRLLFMTTNHISDLDPALIRPGRADYRVEFFNANAQQGTELFQRFYPASSYIDAENFGKWVETEEMSMAAVQEFLLHRSDSVAQALRDSCGVIRGTGLIVDEKERW